MKWLISRKVRAVNTSSATTETADRRNRVSASGEEEAGEKAREMRHKCKKRESAQERLHLRDHETNVIKTQWRNSQ